MDFTSAELLDVAPTRVTADPALTLFYILRKAVTRKAPRLCSVLSGVKICQ